MSSAAPISAESSQYDDAAQHRAPARLGTSGVLPSWWASRRWWNSCRRLWILVRPRMPGCSLGLRVGPVERSPGFRGRPELRISRVRGLPFLPLGGRGFSPGSVAGVHGERQLPD